MLKVAGNNENGSPRAFLTDDAGRTVTVRKWTADEIAAVENLQIRTTDASWSNRVDVSGFSTISLRVSNAHDQPVSLIFGMDVGEDNTVYLKNYGGTNLGFTIPANSGVRMITPEEFPFLQYLKYVKVRCSCGTAPTSGYLTITIIGRG
jgi:hypothetical protein